jgi:hypothetical protein
MKKGPDLNTSLESANDLQVAIQHLCKRCEKPLNGPNRGKIMLAVRLFGLKRGYRLCRCGQTIFNPKKNPVNWEGDEWQQVLSIDKAKIKVGH